MPSDFSQLASGIVQKALDRGATGAECTIAEGDEFSVSVRMREVENIKEAGSKGVGLRVLVGNLTGAAQTVTLCGLSDISGARLFPYSRPTVAY